MISEFKTENIEFDDRAHITSIKATIVFKNITEEEQKLLMRLNSSVLPVGEKYD